ncbi:MAG: 50S ribosome-binding GTPase [Lachnospiraceae bacterium]|nr:50S ribosome-binding GTPase [Lachnospiraceae bacterium]
MKDNNMKIEQRIQNMKNFYVKAGDLIDKLPDAVPQKARTTLKDVILGDKDLKKLMDGIDSHRPPRIFLIGRTGVGKSSLINALCGCYVASVSDTHSCTESATIYKCKDGNRVLMEICDTRGIAESESINSTVSAEQMLVEQINEFSPDVAILMLNCTHRDDVDSDVKFLKKLSKSYLEINSVRLPIVVVVNKCDEMAPTRFKSPAEYPQSKIRKIEEVVQNYRNIIVKSGLKIDNIVAVSSLIDWKLEDGTEIDVENIDSLPVHDIENLQMSFDGRYNIEELLDILEEAIQDFEAQMGLRMAARLTEVVHRLAKHLNSIFSAIAGTVALTPIPVSDIYILIILQSVLVSLIASLSGRDLSLDAAKEFILSLGGVTGVGYTLRFIAQQASKFINAAWPGAGSAISSIIAAAGTSAIGQAAIAYYIDGSTLEGAKKKFEQEKDKKVVIGSKIKR